MTILKLGLMRIRGAASRGDYRHCEVESDHLHNIPSYIAEGDQANHLFYLAKEVPFYLEQTDLKIEGNMDLVRWYIPLWAELEELVPIETSPWRDEWLAMKAGGWDLAETIT